MGFIGWIIIGGLAGWIASMFAGADKSMGLLANIVVGIIGAVIGGWVVTAVGADSGVNGFNLWSLFVAVLGSFILLVIVKLFTGKSNN